MLTLEIIKQQKKLIKLQDYFLLIFVIIVIGMLMNVVAVFNNGGRMPVLERENFSWGTFSWETDKHFSYDNPIEIKYSILSDRIYFLKNIFSIGDIVMISGFLVLSVFLVKIIRQKNKLKKLEKEWGIQYK